MRSLERGGTVQSSESVEKVTREFNRLRSELVEFDRRVNDLRESIHSIESE